MLRGEVSSKARPLNSLLEADLDFEHGSSGMDAAPLTQEAIESIDELIRGRVKEGLWDDVVRKAAAAPGAYRPKAAGLSHEKSKASLSEVYEQQYDEEARGREGRSSAAEEARSEAHDEARALLSKLTGRLDALFDFHFAPKPHKAEASVRKKVGAVALEEAMPTAVASSAALAPEEVYVPSAKGNKLVDGAELSQNERRARRAKKKRVFKRREAEREEQQAIRAAIAPGGAAAKRIEGQKAERELAEAKRKGRISEGVQAADGARGKVGARDARGGSEFTRSAQFFRKLQEGGVKLPAAGKKRAGADAADGEARHKAAKLKL